MRSTTRWRIIGGSAHSASGRISHRGDLGPHGCTLPNRTPSAKAFDFAIRCGENALEWDDEDWECQTARAIGKILGLDFGACDDGMHFVLPNWRPKV